MPLNLPTLADVQRVRRAPQKGLPTVLVKAEKAKSKKAQDEAFRAAVWKRDKGKSRATGKPLKRGGTASWDELGEVDHSYLRSLAPEKIYDVSNGILLSKTENRLRKVACSGQPEFKMFDYTGPEDLSKPQTFVWRDKDGKILKKRTG